MQNVVQCNKFTLKVKEPLVALQIGPIVATYLGPFVATHLGPFVATNLGPFVATQLGPFVALQLGPYVALQLGPFVALQININKSNPEKIKFLRKISVKIYHQSVLFLDGKNQVL